MPKRVSRSRSRSQTVETGVLSVKRRDSMQELLEDRLQKLAEVEIRSMFGGAGIYAEGTMFGTVHDGRVYLKTNASTQAAFVDLGMKAFRPPRGAVLKSYYEVPPDTLDDETEFLTWARRALAISSAKAHSTKARIGRRITFASWRRTPITYASGSSTAYALVIPMGCSSPWVSRCGSFAARPVVRCRRGGYVH